MPQQSREDLLADALDDDFDVEVKKKLAPPTSRGRVNLIESWENYKLQVEEMRPELDVKPTLPWLKRFFKDLAHRPGQIGKRVTVQTLIQYASTYQGIFKREYNIQLSSYDVACLKDYIKCDLKSALNLSSQVRSKIMFRPENLKELIHFIWAEDTHRYRKERSRLQFHWLNLLLFYTISRPGAVVVPRDYEKSQMCLQYQDCKLYLEQVKGGSPKISLKVAFRFRKNEKLDDNSTDIILWENSENPSICPVKPFLALALKDGAFDQVLEEKLFQPLAVKKVQINIKRSMLAQPVLINSSGSGLTYNAWASALQKFGFRMGLEISPSSYSSRRHGANVLNKHATPAELQKVLGHASAVPFRRYYLSNIINLDLQSLTMGQQPRENIAAVADSLAAARKAPYRLPDNLHDTSVDTEEVRNLTKRRDDSPFGKYRVNLTNELTVLKHRLRHRALKKLRNEFFNTDEDPWESEPPKLEQKPLLHPTRQAVVDLFYCGECSTTTSKKIIHEFMNLLALGWADGKPTPPLKRKRDPDEQIQRPPKKPKQPAALVSLGIEHGGKSNFCCPYASCTHHAGNLGSLDIFRVHFAAKHRVAGARTDLCSDEECPTHRGALATLELKIIHQDLEKIMGRGTSYELSKQKLRNWYPAEVLV